MASELRVDKIIPTTGAPTGGGGGIIQVVSTSWNSTTSSTSTSFVEISSNLRTTITPNFTSSKILVTSCLYTSSANSRQTYRMYRSIAGGAYGQAPNASADGTDNDDGMYNLYTNSEAFMKMNSFTFLDAPATTGAVIYSHYWSVSGGTIYINRDAQGDTNRGVSTITVMEVSA